MIPGVTPVPDNKTTILDPGVDKSLGKDDFLRLLVAQLSAQDPLDPMKAQDFSAQLAQFSSLEQMTNVNKNLEIIQQFELALQNSASVNLIGKTVESPGNTFIHSSGTPELLSYSLDSEAGSIRIEIYDSEGTMVDSIKLNNQAQGKNQATWDGFDVLGNQLPAGTYSFKVTAENTAGEPIGTDTFSAGLVTDVIFDEGQTYAVVNGKQLPINEIKRVSINQ